MNITLICIFAIYLFEGLVFSTHCSALFKSRYSIFILHAATILIYSAFSGIYFMQHPVLDILCIAIGNFFIAFLFCQIKWFTALFHSMISVLMMGLTELFVATLIPYPASFQVQSWDDFPLWFVHLTCCAFLYFLTMLVIRIPFNLHRSSRTEFDKSFLLLMIPPAISGYFVFALDEVYFGKKYSFSLDGVVSVCTILLIVLNVTVSALYGYMSEKKQKYAEMKQMIQHESDLVQNYQMLKEQVEIQYQFAHDVKKHLRAIAVLNQNQQTDKIDAYIEDLIHSPVISGSFHLCSNEFLNAILSQYQIMCKNQHIDFCTNVRGKACDFLSEADLTALFCNLLDNAIEAAAKKGTGYIQLSSTRQKGTPYTVITVVNSCVSDPFISSGRWIRTNKKDRLRHGHGLKIINRVVTKYAGGIEMFYSEEQEFHTILTLTDPELGNRLIREP